MAALQNAGGLSACRSTHPATVDCCPRLIGYYPETGPPFPQTLFRHLLKQNATMQDRRLPILFCLAIYSLAIIHGSCWLLAADEPVSNVPLDQTPYYQLQEAGGQEHLGALEAEALATEQPRNRGLSEPMPASMLPQTAAPYQRAHRKLDGKVQAILVNAGDGEHVIAGGWRLIEAEKLRISGEELSSDAIDTSDWHRATVPGTVLTTLVDAGIYPDPFFGLNNMAIPEDLCRKKWWYRTEFILPDVNNDQNVSLVFNGINYEANIWLNGTKLGTIKGAFLRGNFPIQSLLKQKNVLAVEIIPPPHPGIPHEQSALSPRGPNGGGLTQDGPTFICSEGWDWMPAIRDRNIGLWQDVRLKITSGAKIVDPQVVTDLPLPATDRAKITVSTTIDCQNTGDYRLVASMSDWSVIKKLQLPRGQTTVTLSPEEFQQLIVHEPKLWWPNGYGEACLQEIKLQLLGTDSEVVDEKTVRFGIREYSYEFMIALNNGSHERILFNPTQVSKSTTASLFDNVNRKVLANNSTLPTLRNASDLDLLTVLDGDNPYLTIKCNGVPIFCKGGNWGMDDAMKRVSRERLEPYFKLHRDANYTMIRNWTGESTEEVFYELADEYGMMVWNDFWMSTEGYNMPPADFDLFMQNAEDTVKRYRNHPSIALWCARNEGYAPKGLDKRLGDLIAKEDGTRHYQSNSRSHNLRNSGPWTYYNNIDFYFNKCADGFSTEVGTQSFPTVESMEAMMPAEDLWPVNDNWYYHDLHTEHQNYRAAIIGDYAEAFNLHDFSKRAQMLNYVSHRAIFESWNAKLWKDASGVLLWMSHPAWPSMIWQTYSSDYETYGAYYGAKKGCEPLHIQLNNHNKKIVVTNTSLKTYADTEARVQVLDKSGKQLHTYSKSVAVPVNAKVECFDLAIPNEVKLPTIYFLKLQLMGPSDTVLADNFYWESTARNKRFYDLNQYENVILTATGETQLTEGVVRGTIRISNPSSTVALPLKLGLRNAKNGVRVLPAYFSDGYFPLMPNESRVVTFEASSEATPEEFAISAEGYNVERHTVLTFRK